MRKRMIFKLVTISMILLAGLFAGCNGGKEEITEESQSFYYDIEEYALPALKDSSAAGNKSIITDSPLLFGDKVFCNSQENNEEQEITGFYINILDTHTSEWTSINVMESAFEFEGIKYDGLNSQVSASADNEMYVQAYISENESYENYLCRLSSNGVEEVICAVPEEFKEEWNLLTGKLSRDKDGNFYAFSSDSNVINYYDSSLQKQQSIDVSAEIYGILQGTAGAEVYWYGSGTDHKPVLGNLTEGTILFESVEGLATDYIAGISPDHTIFMADTQNVWKVIDGVPQKVYQFGANNYYISELYGMEVISEEEVRFLVKMDGEWMLLHMKEIDEPVEKQEITIAFATRHLGLDKSIARFNRQSDSYHIELLLPEEGETEDAFRTRMQMEIAAERGPDILGHDMVLDVENSVENGYLVCVDDIFADRSLYLEAALEASEVNGKLYGVPYDCTFDVVAYSGADVGDDTSWTLADFMYAVENSDAEILQENMDGVDIVRKYILYDNSNTEFIDWENGKSHLTDASFIEVLEFAKEYADTGEGDKKAFAETILVFMKMSQIKDVYGYFDGDAVFLGYPRSAGYGIYVNPRSLYLNAGSDCQEGAKEFLTFIVSEEEQEKYVTYDITEQIREEGVASLSGYDVQFPVSLKAYDVLIASELEMDESNVVHTDSGTIYLDALYTEEMLKQFDFMLEHSEPGDFNASAISGIIYEELAPYFAGEVSAEMAAEKLDNRVQLYLDE